MIDSFLVHSWKFETKYLKEHLWTMSQVKNLLSLGYIIITQNLTSKVYLFFNLMELHINAIVFGPDHYSSNRDLKWSVLPRVSYSVTIKWSLFQNQTMNRSASQFVVPQLTTHIPWGTIFLVLFLFPYCAIVLEISPWTVVRFNNLHSIKQSKIMTCAVNLIPLAHASPWRPTTQTNNLPKCI